MGNSRQIGIATEKLSIINAYAEMIMNDYRLDNLDKKHLANIVKEEVKVAESE